MNVECQQFISDSQLSTLNYLSTGRGWSVEGRQPELFWPSTLNPKHSTFSFHWGVQDSNLRRQSHQIYSLTRLTASVTPRVTSNSPPSRKAENRFAAARARGHQISTRADSPIIQTIEAGSMPIPIAQNTHRTHGATAPADSPRPLVVAHSFRSQNPSHFPLTSRSRSLDELAEGLEPTTC